MKCANVDCSADLNPFALAKYKKIKRGPVSKYRFCVKCRVKGASLRWKCVDCTVILDEVNNCIQRIRCLDCYKKLVRKRFNLYKRASALEQKEISLCQVKKK